MINPHPGLPKFDYIKPESLSQASQFLAEVFSRTCWRITTFNGRHGYLRPDA